jgi:hypothetical protein
LGGLRALAVLGGDFLIILVRGRVDLFLGPSDRMAVHAAQVLIKVFVRIALDLALGPATLATPQAQAELL